MTDLILQFSAINKSFFGVQVLKDINLDVGRGRVFGLIGENGAGKSTLMNILGGVIPFDSGQMLLNGQAYVPRGPGEATQAGIAFIHQELNLFTNLSIAENFFISDFPQLGRLPFLNQKDLLARSQEFLSAVDLHLGPNTLVEKLSPGERQLVEVAKALNQDASIIIFDEPTTSLTARETQRLFGMIERLQKAGKTVIYISHILRDVMQLADDIAVLRNGEVVRVGAKAEYTIPKMISLMVGRDIGELYPQRTSKPTDTVLLKVQNLSKAGIVHDIQFDLHAGELLGVFGLMGSGRSELAQILFGLEGYDRGEVIINGKTIRRLAPPKSISNGVAFITENRREEGLLMNATVADNLGLAALRSYLGGFNVIRQSPLSKAIQDMAATLKIKVTSVFKNQAKGLSGGNQQKVVLGKWLMTEPSILIADEPTRGVDVGAKHEIYALLDTIAAKGAGVMFISSEIEELIGMCDRIIVMGYGELLGSFERGQFEKEDILRTAFRETVK